MRVLLTGLLLAFAQMACADELIERYGALPTIQKMSVSPDGEKIAFRVVNAEKDLISVVSVNPVKPLSAFNVKEVKPRDIRFLDDNNLVMSVSQNVSIPGFQGRFEMSVATAYNIKKKQYSQLLVPGKNDIYAGQSSLSRVVGVAPDGKSVYMPAHSGEPSFINGQQVEPPVSLFRAKIGGSGRARLHKRGRGNTVDYFVADDGNVLARETYDDAKNKHSIYAYQGKKGVEIFSEETDYIRKSFIGVSLDEKKLIWRGDGGGINRMALYTMALADGKIEGPLYDREDADVAGVITDIQRKVLGVRYSGFLPSYRFFDVDLDSRVKNIVSKFPNHSVWIEDISPDRQHVLVRVEGTQAVGDYYLYSKGKKTVFITSNRPQIPVDQIHPITPITFKARDGMKIPTLLTVPRNKLDSLKNLPAIIMPHGGPASSDFIGFDFMAQALAQQGYLVIQPQFRGSAGFGIDHLAAGYGEWGGKALDDVSDAVGFFVKQGMVDPEKVCIVGASYGGYSALAGGAFTPDLYKCVVSVNGIGNLEDMLSRTKNERGRNSGALAYWRDQILGRDEQVEANAKQRSPELFAGAFKAPVLLIHSELDENVHPRQSVKMYRALKSADKQVEKVELKKEDHYLSNNETRIQALNAIVNFVNQHL